MLVHGAHDEFVQEVKFACWQRPGARSVSSKLFFDLIPGFAVIEIFVCFLFIFSLGNLEFDFFFT